ncbi:MAG: DeoR/GlpR family DNA-binding transcription regulator [Tropicimonas sp.]|uniref:DeoR/GlpR family DNA-binding transcription regulator n=1 Tax=Tropicimonas sp. TaxID=2067044 RepID=UPI003A8BF847
MRKRLQNIRDYLFAHDFASIHDLADRTGTSVATIRRDLSQLEKMGFIERSHGGARLVGKQKTEAAFSQRETERLEQKRAIVQEAYRLIKPHTSCFFDSGTTLLQLAKAISVNPMPISVFTNGLFISQTLMAVPDVETTMLGGNVVPQNAALSGPIAEAALERLMFDQLFLGAGAIGLDGVIYTRHLSEANLHRKLLDRAPRCILLVDSSKFNNVSTHAVSHINSQFHVITDRDLDNEVKQRLLDSGARITFAGR